MWKLLIILGIFFTAIAIFYFVNFGYYFFNSFEITNYGYGVLTGNLVFLITGGICLYYGFKLKKRTSQKKNGI